MLSGQLAVAAIIERNCQVLFEDTRQRAMLLRQLELAR